MSVSKWIYRSGGGITEAINGRRGVSTAGGLLVCHEDLECGDEVSKRDRLVSLPLLVGLEVVDEDEVVVVGALVVDLDLSSGALHLDCCRGCCGVMVLGGRGWPSS